MNSEKLMRAIGGISDRHIEEFAVVKPVFPKKIGSKNEVFMTSAKNTSHISKAQGAKRTYSRAVAIAACFFAFVLCAGALIPALLKNLPSIQPPLQQLYSIEIYNGYDEENSGKPLPSQRLALSCMSAYNSEEKIVIDAAMGDEYSYNQTHGHSPSYDTFDVNGYPIFEVYPCDTEPNKQKIDDGALCINGENRAYVKKYSKDDMQKLDISGQYGDISKYDHEFVELDFGKYQAGASGCIAFSFGWQYEKETPNSSDPLSLWEGQRKFIYYYVGEKGVAFSFDSCESAEECYRNNGIPQKERIANYGNDALCFARPFYTISLNRNEKSYKIG